MITPTTPKWPYVAILCTAAALWSYRGPAEPGARAWETGRQPDASGSVELPVVADEVLSAAVGSRPPARPTLSDEIDHFEARLDRLGPDDRLARGRLVSAYLLRFRAYGSDDDLEAAQRHLEALEVGDSPELLSLRSSLRLAEHDFSGAVADAARANELSGDFDSGLRLKLFDALWAVGSYDEAEDLLALPHDRGAFDYLVREARVLDRRGDVEAARDNLHSALAQARAYAEPRAVVAWALTELGHFEHHSGRPGVAVERYLESLELLPGNPGALEGLAGIAGGVDRNFGAARVLLLEAIGRGGHVDLYLDLAQAAEALGLGREASDARQTFVALATVSREMERQYLRPLALVLADNQPDPSPEALEFAGRDLSLRPTSESWDTRAWVRYRSGDLAGALGDSRKATEWGVQEPLVLYHAGVIAHAADEPSRAASLLRGALEAESELTPRQVRHASELLASYRIASR